MKFRNRARLSLEQLEGRLVPALTANLAAGVLTISGSASSGAIAVAQDTATAGKIAVADGGGAITGSPFTGVNTIKLKLTSADDTVNIDLGGLALPGDVYANLGNGTNALTVKHGTIGGGLNITGGSGTDTVTLGGDGNTLAVTNNTYVNLKDAIDDAFTVSNKVTLNGSLSTDSANNITLATGSDVKKSVNIFGGTGGNIVTLSGTIEKNVDFFAPYVASPGTNSFTLNGAVTGNVLFFGSNRADTFTVASTATVGGNIRAYIGGGGDTVSIAGSVTGNVYVDTGRGGDTITISATVGGNVHVDSGRGNDTVTVSGSVTGNTSIDSGRGDDNVSIASTAKLTGNLLITGENGKDTITVAGSVKGNTSIYGGRGADAITIAATANLTGNLKIYGGYGTDTVSIAGTVGGTTNVNTGKGADSVTIAATAKFTGDVQIKTGAGDDSVTLATGATFVTMTIDGGAGTNTFTGNRTLTGLTLVNI